MRLLDGTLVLSPSDLTKFTRCAHATSLDLADLYGTLTKFADKRRSLHTDFIVRKGTEFEQEYVERLARAGNRVLTIRSERRTRDDLRNAEADTLDAMRAGTDCIYQAVFFDGTWVGYADLLQKVAVPSALGGWSYEVVDTKLARSPKAHFLLQLAAYSEQLARVQGRRPEKMHVVLGTGETASFRVADFEAYYRHIKRRLEERVARRSGDGTSPYIIDFCSLCEWSLHCWRDLERRDHLVRVANIRRDHVRRLEAAGIGTLTRLAETPSAKVEKIRDETYATLHHQARLQAEQIRTGRHRYELLVPEEERGFERLPQPSPGDVFLDLEADPYAGDGITYLFGIATPDGNYRSWWADSALEQQRAFEAVVDFISARRREHPGMHIYHYSPAEKIAFQRMSTEFGTREAEIDDFLRAHVFTDLFTVVRQALRISQPSYSLKKVEAFYFQRDEEGVFERGGPILAYEEWLETRDPKIRMEIENYNREDCLSTVRLRDWLLDLRREAEAQFGRPIPWFDRAPDEQSPDAIEAELQADAISRALLAGVPDDLITATEEQKTRWLLAHLIHYYRREARPAWWWWFERLKMSEEELIADGESIGGLVPAGVPPRDVKRSLIYTLRFPPQEFKLDDEGHDPATERKVTIESIDGASGTIEIRRGKALAGEPLPKALIPGGPISTKNHRRTIRRFAQSILDHGFDGSPYRAAVDILLRRPRDGSSYLFVQGPPGAGKTWWGAHRIVDLLEEGKRVGVTSNSHKAIHHMLDEVEKVARERGVNFRGLKKGAGDEAEYESAHIATSDDLDDFVDPAVNLIAGTSWLFASDALDRTLDCVFIDEAGQVALASALVIATAARFVYLLGDPLQLAQVSQANHPGTSGASVLEHLLGGDATIPPERGEFLEKTWRMHPDVCRFVSEVVYDGRLEAAEGRERQRVSGSRGLSGTGLRFIPIEHGGNSQSCVEEAERIADEIANLLGATVTNFEGETRPLRESDIMVVAPYNAQVRCVTEVLRGRGLGNVPVGTVDKFQGREAEVVFFSMTTSSGDDLPRDIDFLFSRNRLNVAVSRARCLAVVVASPRLLDVACATPDQMRLVNALCRFVEMAGGAQTSSPALSV
ncbi:MAG TPA: TM0106 family RecB-like putative nuclease [Thermoanaerobaculia bacterium]|nr:TM0106 family RecB-like putative nuclease [Thermoanaerobaculia bacterium]